MKFENTQVWGFEHALRGMRNPKNSWDKSDSYYIKLYETEPIMEGNSTIGERKIPGPEKYIIGPNDLKLAQTLIKAGSEHRKFMRQIFVSVDITAPLYWWKEFDTYKVGTVANSTSTMHKITSSPITLDCFEIDDFNDNLDVYDNEPYRPNELVHDCADIIIEICETLRKRHLKYLEDSKKEGITEAEKKHFQNIAKYYWKELIRWLPESWLQTRTVTMDYENLFAMCSKGQRRFHKLNEWSGQDDNTLINFISWARTLPYAQELIFIDELEEKENKGEENE